MYPLRRSYMAASQRFIFVQCGEPRQRLEINGLRSLYG